MRHSSGRVGRTGQTDYIKQYLSTLNTGDIDLDRVVTLTTRFTPADLEYLFQKVAQLAFEREYASKQDYKVITDTFAEIVGQVRPSLTDEMIEEFGQDSETYTRT